MTNKSEKEVRKRRPKNVWNSLRKLESFLKKADIQANIFLDSLYELRENISFDVKRDIARELCNSVNGDLLHMLQEKKNNIESDTHTESHEQEEIIISVFDTLTTILNLSPVRSPCDQFNIKKEAAKNYSFDDYPESLDDDTIKSLNVEVLKSGWKIDDKVVVKPVVFEIIKK